MLLPTAEVSSEVASIRATPTQPTPLFFPDEEPATQTPPIESGPDLVHPPPTQFTGPLSDEELRAWTRTLWAKEVLQLASFGGESWGTAYQTIAEVQLLLRIGKKYRMNINFALHHVSPGRFVDRDHKERAIDLQLLGSHLNGQTPGTWTNKLTFFFAVHHFLTKTETVTTEDLVGELREARQAMLSWGVTQQIPASFLPTGDPRTVFRITPLHRMIRQYMLGL